jgi:hypothetical protein
MHAPVDQPVIHEELAPVKFVNSQQLNNLHPLSVA